LGVWITVIENESWFEALLSLMMFCQLVNLIGSC